MHVILDHLYHWVGLDGGPYYNGYSGLLTALVIAGSAWAALRKHICVVNRCYRFSRHVTEAGHSVCRVHHPDHSNKAPTAQEVHDAHHAARRLKAVR